MLSTIQQEDKLYLSILCVRTVYGDQFKSNISACFYTLIAVSYMSCLLHLNQYHANHLSSCCIHCLGFGGHQRNKGHKEPGETSHTHMHTQLCTYYVKGLTFSHLLRQLWLAQRQAFCWPLVFQAAAHQLCCSLFRHHQ